MASLGTLEEVRLGCCRCMLILLGLRSPRTMLLFHLGLPDSFASAPCPLLGRGILVPPALMLDFVVPFLVGGLDSSGEAG